MKRDLDSRPGDGPLEGKRVLVIGGTGSLGKALVRRLLAGELGRPARIVVFSRDEAKQHEMRLEHLRRRAVTDEVIYENHRELLSFVIGDVRDRAVVVEAVRGADLVFHAAALKQVPTCEYFPHEAVQTNVLGAVNLVRAVRELDGAVELVVGISTDKACKPINAMGMTKALQERIIVEANLHCTDTRLLCVRYGNVLASRGSVVPLFAEQIAHGGPVTVTTAEMTRFFLPLSQAIDTIFAAVRHGTAGETWVPRLPSARIVDVAGLMADGHDVEVVFTGIRPGEKTHEVLVSEEERFRTVERDDHYVILPILPELRPDEPIQPVLDGEYSSADVTLDRDGLRELLSAHLPPRTVGTR